MLTRLALVLTVALGAASAAAPSRAQAAAQGCTNHATGSSFHTQSASAPILPEEQLPGDAASVPTWSGSFTTGGVNYPYTMVGTDPAAGSTTTHVPVEIIPLRLDFAGNGCVLEDSGMAADIEASPLFTPTRLITGVTQYLDDVQRSGFWSSVSTVSPGYHLLLDASDIPVVTLHVPASQGLTAFDPTTDRLEGVVGGQWLFVQLVNLLSSLHISPQTLAAFVPYNTFVTDQNPNDCFGPDGCAFYTGFHDAVLSNAKPHAINTFAMASFLDLGSAVPPQLDFGSDVLSHEILEWANDPFDHGARVQGQPSFFANTAPAWSSPFFGGGCTTILEVADPLENGPSLGVPALGSPTVYALADAVYLSWFARESPSTAVGGLYDEGGIFSTFSDAC